MAFCRKTATYIMMSGFAAAMLAVPSRAAGEIPEGSILSFDAQLIMSLGVQWLNVLLLTVALVYLLYKPVKKYMADRTDRIRSEIDAARKEHKEALELKEKYERMIAGIEKERDEVLHQTHKKAMERSDQLLFDARREAEAMQTRAIEEIKLERENVNEEMKRQIIEISTLMASRFITLAIDRETHDRLINEALVEWTDNG